MTEPTSHEKKQMKKQQKEEQRDVQRSEALSANRKSAIIKYSLIGIAIVLLAYGAYALSTKTASQTIAESENPSGDEYALGTTMLDESQVVYHIHPTLEIEILGARQAIPANIGISAAGLKVIHTHDATGTIHVESPIARDYYMRNFFKIWNKAFNSTCIFEYCTDESHELKMSVNGNENTEFENLSLQDKDQIRISYSEKPQEQ